MRGFRRIAVAALVLVGCAPATGQGEDAAPRGKESAVVTKNTDGDTLHLSGLGSTRLIGVDTPEVYGGAECYGREASSFVERLAPPGTRVHYRLGVEPRDRYGRALAYVWLEDGRFLNLKLVQQGYAQVLTIPPNVDYAERFVAAQRKARNAERGLWAPGACGG